MTRDRFSTRCLSICFVACIVVCALFIGAANVQAAGGPSAGTAYASNGVSASIRGVQPAVSGLFQVHAPRAWVDALDENGVVGANGVADFLDSWDAFTARASSAILKNSYAFTTVDGLGHEVLYAGVQRASSGGPSSVVFEFSQTAGGRLPGDLRISAEIHAAGSLGTVSFESYTGDAKGIAKFLPVAILAGEGCNDAGTACVVANGALLEIGYNLTALSKAEKDFAGIQITTPEDHVVGTMSALAGAPGGCVKEVGGINPVCTANDVRLAGVVSGTVQVVAGDGCNPNDPSDTVTLNFTGIFTSGPQRYDVGSYIATDGGGTDGARSGQCTRFALKKNEDGTSDLDGDTCGDIQSSKTLQIPVGPVTVKCSDAFHVDALGNAVAGGDGNLDFFHCETWAQSSGEINCTGSASVKAGTPSKCGCGFLGAEAGFCAATPDSNLCDTEICQGSCQPASGTGGSGTLCTVNADCTTAGETCRGIHVVHIPVADGSSCGSDPNTGNPCDLAPTCQAGSCTANFAGNTTECRASAGDCDVADFCTGSSATCPTDVKSSAQCRASAGDCDLPESCDGATNDCPADGFKTNAVQCRAAAGDCDVAESCSGSSATCPSDSKSTAECRASGGVCDPAESCNGTSNDCPTDSKSTAVCHPSQGVCDPEEICDGTGNDCPADAKSTASCRVSAGDCDVAESCNGTSNDCPADAKSTASCRASAGDCDIEEFCDGTNTSCPADGFKSSSVVCRESIERCDLSEHCTGTSAECPGESCSGS